MANLTGTQASDWRSDGSLAYGLFRFTFGVNIMMRGIVRIAMGLPAFQTYMLTQFKDVPVMPPAFLIPFASVLPFVETLIGSASWSASRRAPALVAGSLMIAALTFGRCSARTSRSHGCRFHERSAIRMRRRSRNRPAAMRS